MRESLAMAGHAIVHERRALAATVRSVGPDATTLIAEWTAIDVAAHVASLDRFGGIPTFVGRRIVANGVRLNDTAGQFADRGLRSTKKRGFEQVLRHLENEPPGLLLRRSVSAVGLFEVFVHHEDIRRANEAHDARVSPHGLDAVVPWLLRYHRTLLRNIRLVVSTPDGEWVEGSGPTATLVAPTHEAVLWLAGRRAASAVELTGEAAEAVEAAPLRI